MFDCVIVGFGPSALATLEVLRREDLKLGVVLGVPLESGISFGSGVTRLYRSSGVYPIFGKPTFPFGESACQGGGAVINGGLFWDCPEHVRTSWAAKFPDSAFADASWGSTHEMIRRLFKVQGQSLGAANENIISRKMLQLGAHRKVERVDRSVKGCRFDNRCGAGCLADAKVTPLSYLDLFKNHGVDFYSANVLRISPGVRGYELFLSDGSVVKSSKVILCAGVTGSFELSRRSGLVRQRYSRWFNFHLNFRICAFNKNFSLNPRNATMLGAQVQCGLEDGWVLMPQNFNDSSLNNVLRVLPLCQRREIIDHEEGLGIFSLMVRVRGSGRIGSILGLNHGHWRPDAHDYSLIKNSLREAYKVMQELGFDLTLAQGAEEDGFVPVDMAIDDLPNVDLKDMTALAVHGFSTCRMGWDEMGGLVDSQGKMFNTEGIFVFDASSLPSNIGESPVGTITTMAAINARRLVG